MKRIAGALAALGALLLTAVIAFAQPGSGGAARHAAVGSTSATHSAARASTGGAPAAAPCTPPPAGNHEITVQAGRVPVLLHVPPGATTTRRPLILVLPGARQNGHVIATYTGYSRLSNMKGFLVAYPTATGSPPFWNISGTPSGGVDDVTYLRNVITTLTGPAACADPAHVGVTGVSNGGGMSALLACRAADLLAAAAPVAGGYSTLPDCEPSRPLPILEIHSLNDKVVPYEGKGASHAGAVVPFLDDWRHRDRCTGAARRSNPADDVTELRWSCADGRVVVHDRVVDADHGWPGESSLRPFSSTYATWSFLSSFRDDADDASRASGAAAGR